MTSFIRKRQSYLLALIIAVAVSVWILSGELANSAVSADATAHNTVQARLEDFRVRVATLDAEAVSRTIVLNGRTAPSRAVTLRAETDGRVIAVEAERGAELAEGDVVVRLDLRDREARLREARALVEQRKLESEASEKLKESNFQTETAVAKAHANLESALALVRRVEVDIANTVLRAPFDGVLDRRPVEIGD